MIKSDPLLSLLQICTNPSDRLSKDKEFYTFQEHLNNNKKIAGISVPKYCSGNNFNIRDRFLEIENIHATLNEQLNNTLIEIENAESKNNLADLHLVTEPLIAVSFQIKDHIAKVIEEFNRFSKDRSFLPLIYPSYENYSRFVKHFDFNVYFLEKAYLSKSEKLSNFEKIQFDLNELNKVEAIMLGSLNPKDALNRMAEFFGTDVNKIAFTYFNSRFGGFTVYIDPENIELNQKLHALAKEHEDNIGYFEFDPSWVFTFQNREVVETKITNEIDVWFDLDQCVAYVKEQCLPIDLHLDVSIEHDFNLDYLKSIYFDYTPSARLIHRHDVINKLRELIPKENPKHLEIFNGEEFELFNNYRIWSFSEYILIRYKVAEDVTKQAIFGTEILEGYISGYESDDLSIKLYKQVTNNLKLLKISGFEKYNPYILVNDPSTPFEELI